jgi:signal transduction histidine kinase
MEETPFTRGTRMHRSGAPGLRVQILLALGGLLLLAFVPLFFAVASLTRVTLHGVRERSARALGRAVASHVAEVEARDRAGLQRALESHVGEGGVDALCVFADDGTRVACAGDPAEVALVVAPARPYGEGVREGTGPRGATLEVMVPKDDGVVVARLRTDDATDRADPLIRLIGGYVAVFAIALLFLTYVALTRLIVRPVEGLANATDRVASGSRKLDVPKAGARELVELGASVEAMTDRLLADEMRLRKKVDELTETTKRLTEARTQLVQSERLASVGRLAAGMAHEIGNPISAMMGMEELLLAGDVPESERDEYVARLKKETERIHRVLRDLLDFARPERSPESEAEPQEAPVAECVADVIALLRPQKEFRDLELVVAVPSGLRAKIARGRLTQVLLNLALNAGDAMADRRGTTLALRARADATRIVLEIEDDGPGVSDSLRDRIFEPFVTTKDVGEGTGLGLAVCRGIVEGVGGTIALRPRADGAAGACFVVELPVA